MCSDLSSRVYFLSSWSVFLFLLYCCSLLCWLLSHTFHRIPCSPFWSFVLKHSYRFLHSARGEPSRSGKGSREGLCFEGSWQGRYPPPSQENTPFFGKFHSLSKNCHGNFNFFVCLFFHWSWGVASCPIVYIVILVLFCVINYSQFEWLKIANTYIAVFVALNTDQI